MPVAVAAVNVFQESSVLLAQDKRTPKPLYITVITPSVFARADPLFIT